MVCLTCQDESSCCKPAHVSCHHCPMQLCLEHLSEHNLRNVHRVDELSNQLNILGDSVSELSTQSTLEKARSGVEEWRRMAIQTIEKVCQNKYHQIDRLENELNTRLEIYREDIQSKLSAIQMRLNSLQKYGEVSEKQLTPIEHHLRALEQYVHSLTCEIHLETDAISFEERIRVSAEFVYDQLECLEKSIKPYETIPVENMKSFAASGEKNQVLWINQQDELFLVDQQRQTHPLTLPHAGVADDRKVIDVKWCSASARFLLLLLRFIFAFDPETGKWTSIPVVRYKNHAFRCICPRDELSFYLSYDVLGMCVELWEYPHRDRAEPIKRWDDTDVKEKNCLSSIRQNSSGQFGLLRRRGTSCITFFELRDHNFELLQTFDHSPDCIDAVYPFGDHHWLMQGSSGNSFRYSSKTKSISALSYQFPSGFQEYKNRSIVMTNEKNELLFCDT